MAEQTVTILVPVNDFDQAQVNKLQEAINQMLAVYSQHAVVIVMNETQRIVAPLYSTWLDEKHAFALAHLRRYDGTQEPRDSAEARIHLTIDEAFDITDGRTQQQVIADLRNQRGW